MKKVKVYNRNKKHESNHEFDITHTVLKKQKCCLRIIIC